MYDGMSLVMWSKKGRPSHRRRPSHRERPPHRRRPPHRGRPCPTGETYNPVRHKGVRDDGIAPHTQREWCAIWECRNQDIFICFEGQPQTSQARSIRCENWYQHPFFQISGKRQRSIPASPFTGIGRSRPAEPLCLAGTRA